jgi:hypothetical protein
VVVALLLSCRASRQLWWGGPVAGVAHLVVEHVRFGLSHVISASFGPVSRAARQSPLANKQLLFVVRLLSPN